MDGPETPAKTRHGVVVNSDGFNIHITIAGQAVGWGAVENAVREDDERQVMSCKEDIDSLLTFGGLYSAALTALLALSMNMLQEDVAGESLRALRQIAQQTASYQLFPGGALNTTVMFPPFSSPPFQPSRIALRVNMLWFASLVFSLSTASIGILVKQWLRAYTSYRTSSAQGRMRVRHFRRQGMETWKVYKIAAILPFIIQLSLGLFFIGLCYFTAEVNPELGRATLPLVAGWALFIFVVTILPIFSSYCPYKPASFEVLYSIIRRRLFRLATLAFSLTDRLVRGLKQQIARLVDVRLCGTVSNASTSSIVIPSLSDMASVTDARTEATFFGNLALWAKQRTPDCPKYSRPYDEADAVKYSGNDVNILLAADTLQSDDELLGTAILDALKQSQPTLNQTATFLLGALQSRIPSDRRQWRFEDEPTLLDCRSLTRRARTAVDDIVAQIPSEYLVPWEARQGRCWIMCMLVSPSQYPLSAAGLQFLGTAILDHPYALPRHVWRTSVEHPDQTLRLLLSAARHVCTMKNSPSNALGSTRLASALNCSMTVLRPYFQDAELPTVDWRRATFDDHMTTRNDWATILNKSSLQDTVQWIAELLERELELHGTQQLSVELLEDAVSFICRLSATVILSDIENSSDALYILPGVVRRIFQFGEQATAHLELVIRSYISQPAAVMMLHQEIIQEFMHTFLDQVHEETLDHLYQVIVAIINDMLPKDPSIIARLCYTILHVLCRCIDRNLAGYNAIGDNASTLRSWRRIFRRITVTLQGTREGDCVVADGKRLVKECFRLVDDVDVVNDYRDPLENLLNYGPRPKRLDMEQAWRIQFKSSRSPFSNHLIFMLHRLLPCDACTDLDSWRWRLLEAMSEEDRLTALDDDELDDGPDALVDELMKHAASSIRDPEQEDEQEDNIKPLGRQQSADESIQTLVGSEAEDQEDSALSNVIAEPGPALDNAESLTSSGR